MGQSSDLGRAAEQRALRHLLSLGYREIARNYRCKVGEIDLIVEKAGTIVFVEVRYRRNVRFGTPEETVDRRKMRRIIRTAQFFFAGHRAYRDRACRFDVIALSDELNWIVNAFTLDDL